MKNKITTILTISVLISSLFFLNTGCSKKTVIPPDGQAGTDLSGGNNINYPRAEGIISEDTLPAEGSLDDTNLAGGQGVNPADAMLAADQQSDEYKRIHGRCSANLSPVYFDFDQAGIRSDMVEVMIRNSDYLMSVPSARITVEGNSDERGTNEYNLALAERRAINAQQYLINMGVDPLRLRTVSYGEEKPLFTGQDEESYSMNRRVDFVIQ